MSLCVCVEYSKEPRGRSEQRGTGRQFGEDNVRQFMCACVRGVGVQRLEAKHSETKDYTQYTQIIGKQFRIREHIPEKRIRRIKLRLIERE